MRSQGPVKLARGTEVGVTLEIPGLVVQPESNVLSWEGEIANASFIVSVPAGAGLCTYYGEVRFDVAGLALARLSFALTVATPRLHELLRDLFWLGSAKLVWSEIKTRRPRKGFASYARQDTLGVMARVDGLEAAAPDLEVFVDVEQLRNGEHWEQRLREEVLSRDVLYLFWSRAARESVWVDREWRWAYEAHGIDSICPVALEPPSEAPPPPELATLHFGSRHHAYQHASV